MSASVWVNASAVQEYAPALVHIPDTGYGDDFRIHCDNSICERHPFV
jgi:hypothetical protein